MWVLVLTTVFNTDFDQEDGLKRKMSHFFGDFMTSDVDAEAWESLALCIGPIAWLETWLGGKGCCSCALNVYIYWNLRILEAVAKELPEEDNDALCARVEGLAEFPRPEASGVFAGMHGDEMGEGEEEEAEFEEESTPSDWSPPVDSQFAPKLRACPDEVPEGLAKGDHIVVWFFAPENAWFEGQVTGILKKGKCRVQCEFVDCGALIEVYADECGTTGGRS
ncbi:hypothetical protein T492DRAFT_873413 [Pavlovales sp. CCMP2436]|nr:hypothetical protein T492DRAFT_873413 [Pavlovales sp. CCMP2436]